MDPTVALTNLLAALEDASTATDESIARDNLDNAAESWEALLRWHTTGGFLPQWPEVSFAEDDDYPSDLIFHLGRLSMAINLKNRDAYGSALTAIGVALETIDA